MIPENYREKQKVKIAFVQEIIYESPEDYQNKAKRVFEYEE